MEDCNCNCTCSGIENFLTSDEQEINVRMYAIEIAVGKSQDINTVLEIADKITHFILMGRDSKTDTTNSVEK